MNLKVDRTKRYSMSQPTAMISLRIHSQKHKNSNSENLRLSVVVKSVENHNIEFDRRDRVTAVSEATQFQKCSVAWSDVHCVSPD